MREASQVRLPSDPRVNEAAFSYYRRLRRVRDHLTSHLSEAFTLSQGASIAWMASASFSRFFKAKVGVPFTVWVKHVRITASGNLSTVLGQIGLDN